MHPYQRARTDSKSLNHTVAILSFGAGAAEYKGDNMNFTHVSRILNLGVAPLVHTLSIVHLKFKAYTLCCPIGRIPGSLDSVNHSVLHHVGWVFRNVSATPLYAGKSEFFLRANNIAVPLDICDLFAFRKLVGEEVLLLSYAVVLSEATLLKQMNRIAETPKIMKKAMDLVLTTYREDSPMCCEINE
jgi:hypothetical protein